MSKAIQFTNPFTPGMPKLPADDLEAMRQAILTDPRRAQPHLGTIVDQFPARIIASAYADERYMFKRTYVSTADGNPDSQITLALLDAAHPRYRYVTATNLAELDTHTHNLLDGTYVWVVKVRDSSSPPKERFLITHSLCASLPAVAIADYNSLAVPPTVAAKLCADWTGAGAFGSELSVLLPHNYNTYPNVRDGWVIGIEYRDGGWEAKQLHLDAPLGSVQLWAGVPADMRAGWELIGAGGYYLAAYDSETEDFDTIKGLEGELTHIHDPHDLSHVHEVPAHKHPVTICKTACTVCTFCRDNPTAYALQDVAFAAENNETGDSQAVDTGAADPDLSNVTHEAAEHSPKRIILGVYERVP